MRLSFDIYSAGVRKRSVEIARINEEMAQVEISEMEHALTNELFNLVDYYGVRVELLNVANENLAAAELNLSISEEKYRSGVINSFNFRDVQLIYLNAALGVFSLFTTSSTPIPSSPELPGDTWEFSSVGSELCTLSNASVRISSI